MTAHVLDLRLPPLLRVFTYHPTPLAKPLVDLLLLGVLDLPAVVLAVDRTLT
jgi:hypothetical protein